MRNAKTHCRNGHLYDAGKLVHQSGWQAAVQDL